LTLPELIAEARRLSELLDRGVAALRDAATAYAEAEHAYRLASAQAYLAHGGTIPEREAAVYVEVGGLKLQRDIAEGMKLAAMEAIRSRRTQLSALQSILAAHREEAAYDRTGIR
jgi:hypothetical protein